MIHFGNDLAELVTEQAAGGFEDSANLDCVSFARMIVKIGYAFAVAASGLDAIREPVVVPAIRGMTDDVGMWVGSHDFVMKSESLGAMHALATGIVPVPVGGRTENLVMSWGSSSPVLIQLRMRWLLAAPLGTQRRRPNRAHDTGLSPDSCLGFAALVGSSRLAAGIPRIAFGCVSSKHGTG
ncbi:MAG: hypothetical protein NTX23_07400 [Candidatus Bipolaricaulota bacterium]|nr:hypothetical protein [Candidatus Bipolaricaulota bacterium]